jgi:hypothetical protein
MRGQYTCAASRGSARVVQYKQYTGRGMIWVVQDERGFGRNTEGGTILLGPAGPVMTAWQRQYEQYTARAADAVHIGGHVQSTCGGRQYTGGDSRGSTQRRRYGHAGSTQRPCRQCTGGDSGGSTQRRRYGQQTDGGSRGNAGSAQVGPAEQGQNRHFSGGSGRGSRESSSCASSVVPLGELRSPHCTRQHCLTMYCHTVPMVQARMAGRWASWCQTLQHPTTLGGWGLVVSGI